MNPLLRLTMLCAWAAAADAPAADTDTVDIPRLAKPGYLESYVDPVFGSRVTRITGDPGTLIPNLDARWDEVARHHYSKAAAWNRDQSILYLGRHHGFPSMLFLDGATYEPLFGRNQSPGTEIRWHPLNPRLMVWVSGGRIGTWDPRADRVETVAEFPGYSQFRIGPWEGNLSLDGRFIAVEGRKGDDRVAFAYDFTAQKKCPDLILNDVEIDWVSVSPSGRYLVLHGAIDNKKGDQTRVYDLAGNRAGQLWADYGRPSHFDMTLDENGDDIAVGVSKSKPDDGRVIKRRLSDGAVTVLTAGGYASHTSARNVDRPGWAYVSYQHRGPTWPPYWDEVVAVKLDGSLTVERIAHLRTRLTDYLTEAHAVPSPDGRRVLWVSNWETEPGRPVGAFVAELPAPAGGK